MSDRVIVSKSKLDTLADIIKSKSGVTDNLTLDEMVDKISSADSDSSLREFLENRTTLKNCCNYYTGKKLVKFTIKPSVRDASYCWYYCTQMQLWDNICDTSLISNLQAAFSACQELTEVVGLKTDNATNISYFFQACFKLRNIVTPLNFDKVTQLKLAFATCKALVEVRFVAATIHWSISFADSPLLSAESVQSIIDGLATVTTAQTITFNRKITLTDAQKQTINEKGWTLVQ